MKTGSYKPENNLVRQISEKYYGSRENRNRKCIFGDRGDKPEKNWVDKNQKSILFESVLSLLAIGLTVFEILSKTQTVCAGLEATRFSEIIFSRQKSERCFGSKMF